MTDLVEVYLDTSQVNVSQMPVYRTRLEASIAGLKKGDAYVGADNQTMSLNTATPNLYLSFYNKHSYTVKAI
jgi:hypothetical protein